MKWVEKFKNPFESESPHEEIIDKVEKHLAHEIKYGTHKSEFLEELLAALQDDDEERVAEVSFQKSDQFIRCPEIKGMIIEKFFSEQQHPWESEIDFEIRTGKRSPDDKKSKKRFNLFS